MAIKAVNKLITKHMIPKQENFTLRRRAHSPKDYDHFKTFGVALTPFLAELLFLSDILDQGNSPKCTAYSAVAVRTSMKSRDYDPDSQWGAELTFMGVQTAQGSDIETEASVGVETGFMPVVGSGIPVYTDRASAYFWVHKAPSLDMFDSIRTTITQIRQPLMCGIAWYADWNTAPGGIVPYSFKHLMGGHALKIAGWKTINDIPYLAIQNSWGEDVGDNGVFYFPREVANKIFTDSIAYWADSTVPKIQKLGLISAMLANLIALITQLRIKGKTQDPEPPVKPIIPAKAVTPPPVSPAPTAPPMYLWDTFENARHSVRVICDQAGLSVEDKNIMCACVQVESNFNPLCEHGNLDKDRKVWSTDYGIAQINDYFHIGAGKEFPSAEYVLANPEECIRWMARQWKAGNAHLWSSYTSGAYRKYL